MAPKAGDRIGSYVLVRLLGEGGMGAVFQAQDVSLKRDVAIKFFPLQNLGEGQPGLVRAFKERFIREARIAAMVNHPNVVQVYHAALDHAQPHFVMEYLEGQTLEQLLETEPKLPMGRICYFGLQMCTALRYAWENFQIIHRDLKPANIMILERDRLKLLDLGIAKMVNGTQTGQLTTVGVQVGSPYWMAPEQQTGEGKLDHRCDIYGLGMVLCRMVAQRPPFPDGSDLELHAAKLKGLPFRIERCAPHAPYALVDLIYRMLDPDKEERLDSFQEIEDSLSECLEGLPDAPEQWEAVLKAAKRVRGRGDTTEQVGMPLPPLPDRHTHDAPEPPEHVTTLSLASAPDGTIPVLVDGVLQTPSGIMIEEIPAFLPQMRQLLDRVSNTTLVGKYRIHELIGFGGMGAVFRAQHLPTREAVALKFLIGDEQDDARHRIERFRNEAEIISRLKHPSIVAVRDLCCVEGLNFMAMDLFLGLYGRPVNLRDYCCSFGTANGLLDEEDMQQIAVALLEAVGYAHDNDVVHCDLKPENVLFQCLGTDEDGYWDAHLKLTDFGLAKIVGEELVLNSATRSMRSFAGHDDAPQDAAALIGTYDYMSPEQRRGEPATPASDLFSIGMIMLRLLTGVHELGLRNRPSRIRPELHPDWDDVILKALKEKPSERFANAEAMAAAIADIYLDG